MFSEYFITNISKKGSVFFFRFVIECHSSKPQEKGGQLLLLNFANL